MSRRKPPTPHLWEGGGGMVVRCEDPATARALMVDAWLDEYGLIEVDSDEDVAELFPVDRARIERGRMLGALPNSLAAAEGWSWAWYPDTGRGTTVAVVWSETQ